MSLVNRAAVFYEPGRPFELIELPIPETRPGGLTLRITRSNVCGSDLHNWRGDGRAKPVDPTGTVFGHEAVGVVHELGDGVTADWNGQPIKVGDRIAFQYFRPCGSCRNCQRQMPEACTESFKIRFGDRNEWPYVRGTFADYIYLHPGQAIFKVPDAVPDAVAASANCALSQVIMGLKRVDVTLGDRVVIQGCGGLGIYACAIAKQRGAEMVVAIDGVQDRLDLARQMGADHTINVSEITDTRARVSIVKELTQGFGADVVVEVVGSPAVINEGLRMLGWGGRYLEIGVVFRGEHFECDPGRLVGQNQRIEAVGSYTAACLQHALGFLDKNMESLPLNEVLVEYPLEEINQAFADQEAGKVRRASLVMA